jgi:hypothetical protein
MTRTVEAGDHGVGRILDDLGFGGTQAIRAALFAQAGCEDHPIVQEQIAHSLQIFQTVNQVESIESLAQPYRGSLVFRPGVCWPSIYHLRLLAWTQTWRRKDDLNMLVESVQRLVNLSPLPNLHVKWKSQAIAPALSACMISTPILPGWTMQAGCSGSTGWSCSPGWQSCRASRAGLPGVVLRSLTMKVRGLILRASTMLPLGSGGLAPVSCWRIGATTRRRIKSDFRSG